MSAEIPPLLDEDFEAAGEVADMQIRKSEMQLTREQLVRGLAEIRALSGARDFRLNFGLDSPRHIFERLSLEFQLGKLSQEDFKLQWQECVEQPVNPDTLRAYIEDHEQYLVWYGKLLQLPFLRGLDDREIDQHAKRYRFELNRSTSLPPRQLELIAEFLEEARIEKLLGQATIGEYRASYAGGLVLLVTNRASDAWESVSGIAHRSQTELHYSHATTAAELFTETWIPKLPSPNDLMSLLREEFAIGRSVLQQRQTPPSPTHVIENQFAPTVELTPHFEVNIPSSQTASGSNKKSQTKQQTAIQANYKPNLENWAVGIEALGKWWLFHFDANLWKQRGIVKIPAGQPEGFMDLLAQNGGAMSKTEAFKLIRPVYPGSDDQRLGRAVTEALKKARRAIREAIAKAARCDVEDVKDPIPPLRPGWRSKIEIGYAIQDSDGKIIFKLKHEMGP